MMMMMSLSEMEKIATEDDCVDSGAETGGSDYSPMSSASRCGGGESSTLDRHQDPFLVSVHLIADPGQGPTLQRAADAVLSWVHPELQLFRVSERASSSSSTQRSRLKPRQPNGGLTQPALAVVLFLQESYNSGDGEEEEEEEQTIAALHRALQRPPWRYHHTEKVSDGRRMLPLAPRSQDFFTLGPAPGTPLWAARTVHYGKEIVRFTVYCRHDTYADMVRLYRLLLQRRVAAQKSKKEDFCFFVAYSNPATEVQLSLKRLPRGQSPVPTEAAVMEVRVRDVGALVPLLPRPCSPISEARWQTEDYDGNKILLQIQGSRFKSRRQDANMAATMCSPLAAESLLSGPYALGCSSSAAASSHARNNNRRYRLQASQRTATATCRLNQAASLSQASLPLTCEEMGEEEEEEEEEEQWDHQHHHHHHHPDSWRSPWRNLRSSSLFSLPGLGTSSHSNGSSPAPSSPAPPQHLHYTSHSLSRCASSHLAPPFRLNVVDALVGAEETDVDTGDKVDSDVDLTVVSAYIKSSLPRTQTQAQTQDIGPAAPSPGISLGTAVVVKASKTGRPPTVPKRTSSLSSNSTLPSTLPKSRHPQSTCLNASSSSRSPSLSDFSVSRWDSSNSVSTAAAGLVEDRSFQNKHKEEEEEDQEFYI